MNKKRFLTAVLSSKKLKAELLIAFGLIGLAILVLVGYLFPGQASFFSEKDYLPVVMGIICFIAVVGFVIIAQIVNPVVKITREAMLIAKGDLSRDIQMAREDELGELALALNAMTQRIRQDVDELKKLSQTTGAINEEINRRIATLSDMMELSNRIAQNDPLDQILQAAGKKCLATHAMDCCAIILKDYLSNEFKIRQVQGRGPDRASQREIAPGQVRLGEGLLGKAILKQTALFIDARTPPTRDNEEFKKTFSLRNAAVLPISSKGNAFGLLVVGNEKSDYVFGDIEKELLQLLAKNIAIAVLNNLLTQEIEKLEMTDALTGLFNNTFARNKLSFEIQEAMKSQRSCSFVLLKLSRLKEYRSQSGHIQAEDALIKIAAVLKANLNEAGRAARFSDDEFALILPQKNKKESIDLAQEIILEIGKLFAQEDISRRLACVAAVVENPLDGVTADELILKSGIILADTLERDGPPVGY